MTRTTLASALPGECAVTSSTWTAFSGGSRLAVPAHCATRSGSLQRWAVLQLGIKVVPCSGSAMLTAHVCYAAPATLLLPKLYKGAQCPIPARCSKLSAHGPCHVKLHRTRMCAAAASGGLCSASTPLTRSWPPFACRLRRFWQVAQPPPEQFPDLLIPPWSSCVVFSTHRPGGHRFSASEA